jgi:peptidyl-prolyl cis-trans isomerase C
MVRTSLSMVLIVLGLNACQPAAVETTPGEFPGSGGDPIATVNGQQISSDMLDAVMRGLPPQVKAQIEAMGDTSPLVESLVASELLYQKAIEQGVHTTPLAQQDMAVAIRHALAESLTRQVITERMTDQRIQSWYDEHQVQFAQPQMQLAHIMFTDQAKADQVKAELDAGGDFAALAAANSVDTMTAAKGGEIGWLDLRQMAPPLRSSIEKAAKGDVLGPLSMGQTTHIFRVLDRRDAKPLDEVRDQIAAELEQTIRQEYLEELREAAVVVESYDKPDAAAPALPDAPPAGPDAAPTASPAEVQEGAAG